LHEVGGEGIIVVKAADAINRDFESRIKADCAKVRASFN